MAENKFCDLTCQESKLVEYASGFSSLFCTKILQALDLAKKEHFGQLRDEGTPYVIHPIRVTLILIRELNIKDPNLLCAALLHDVVEDGSMTIEEIDNQFGLEVARIVKGVTRQKPEKESEKEKEKNKLRKIEKIASSDQKIRLVKLCDKLDNTRSHSFIPEDSPGYKKIPRWNKELPQYLPIAKKTNKKLFELFSQLKGEE